MIRVAVVMAITNITIASLSSTLATDLHSSLILSVVWVMWILLVICLTSFKMLLVSVGSISSTNSVFSSPSSTLFFTWPCISSAETFASGSLYISEAVGVSFLCLRQTKTAQHFSTKTLTHLGTGYDLAWIFMIQIFTTRLATSRTKIVKKYELILGTISEELGIASATIVDMTAKANIVLIPKDTLSPLSGGRQKIKHDNDEMIMNGKIHFITKNCGCLWIFKENISTTNGSSQQRKCLTLFLTGTSLGDHSGMVMWGVASMTPLWS